MKSGLREMKPSRILLDNEIKRRYSTAFSTLRNLQRSSSIKTAVVIHLYYTENWSLFKKKLELLSEVTVFDIYVTLPNSNAPFIDTIIKDFTSAHCIICPNRGRDVLPFIMVGKELKKLGYEAILKFHSKKSTHWDGGQEWLEHTLDQIIPEDKDVLKRIADTILDISTGVIGPAEYYYPLTVNFPANGTHLSRYVTKYYGKKAERAYLQVGRKEYGFFGGTMLWMRIDALGEIFNSSARQFELEAGQIDGTYAHAIERLLCVVPEIEGRTNYESDGHLLKERPYASENIPDWSTDHNR